MTKHFHEFPNSSSIRSCEYNEATQDMHIEFVSGGKHCFKGVEKEHFDGLKSADSVGSFFHQHIRRNYKSERL